MKIKLKNIGTLKQAEIDLSKDLIILAGPNNTGKTYAAYTVYGVCDALRKGDKNNLVSGIDGRSNAWIMVLHDIFSAFSKEKASDKNDLSYLDKEQIIESVDDYLDNINERLNTIFPECLGNTFATEISKFLDSTIEILFEKELLKNYLLNTRIEAPNFVKTTPNLERISKEKDRNGIEYQQNGLPKDEERINFVNVLLQIQKYISNAIIDFHFNNLYINTAERSAISIFSKELSIKRNNIVDQLLELRDSKNGDANQLLGKLQRYPLPIRDSLAISEDLANLSRNKSEYGFLADRIEEVLLDGKITTSKDGEVQYSPNKSKVKNLSIHLTASIVKSLSNLVFYFRHIAQKGDFIIIDEPELNLHPDNQRKVARLFGEIINQGFKVMISTHSDYIIRELNNLIMLKSGGEKAEYLANKYGYEEKQLIDYQRVGAYLFNHNKNISLEVTETGFEVNTIDEVINELNNASEEIYFTLFD